MRAADQTVVPIEVLLSSCEKERDALRSQNERLRALLREALSHLEHRMIPAEYGQFYDKVARTL